MTTLYFVRHAEPDFSIKDDRTRTLTPKGHQDTALVTEFLSDKNIDIVLSSPFKRTIDTVLPFAKSVGKEIEEIEDFRERKICDEWIFDWDDFRDFSESQWDDFSYKLDSGECLIEVQQRNIAALEKVLGKYKGKNIVIGTHGTALSTIINHYDNTYRYEDFKAMAHIFPWVVRMDFDGIFCAGMEKINLFKPKELPNYDECIVRTVPWGAFKAYKYTVIFARYKDKWLYCRAKEREGFETAGGKIEKGESILEAAKRELMEETGAINFDIKVAFDYFVGIPTVNGAWANGQVFLAQIHELGDMPNYEMAEIGLFDTIPDKMRFPQILPVLFEYLQNLLNLQTAKNELWDIYDSEKNLTGRVHRRGKPLAQGDYHLVCRIWLLNSKGEFLITRRAPNKAFPNMWENSGGSAVAGDDSLTTAIKEVKEETGLDLKPENGKCLFTFKNDALDAFVDVWLFRQDFDLKDVVLQEGETIDAKYATKDEIREMIYKREFLHINKYYEELLIKAGLE